MTTTLFAPRARIDVSGVTLAAEVSRHVLGVHYDNNLELADMFSIVLDNTANRFTDSPLFELGKSVEIHMGYADELRPMMLGEIASIEPSFPSSGAPTLTISGYDRSQRLRHDVPDRPAFRFMNDSLIASQIAVEAGLIPVVDPSPHFHKKLLQTGSDMSFLKERARANFFDVYVWWDRLYFRFPRPQTEAYVLEWGRNLSSFSPRMSKAGLAGLQVVRSYNEDLAQSIVGVMTTAALDLDAIVERLGEAAVGALASLGRRVIRDQPAESPVEAVALAKALLQEILDGMYEATGSCVGLPQLRAGTFISVKGVGKRFSGMYRLKRVTHSLDQGGFTTTFEVTQRAGSNLLQLLRKSTVETPPPNRPEPVFGVMVGTVVGVDPLQYKVDVLLSQISDFEPVTASCATFMAGADRGAFFLPDVGDQVLVTFAQGNLSKPFVIGSLWSQVLPKAVTGLPGQNAIRRIKTNAGHTITLDDTPLVERIVIEDKAGSTITLEATGKVLVEAKGDIELKARNVKLSAPTGEIGLEARNVKVKVAETMDVDQLT